jgi:putative heme-binding domain-containing protein
VAANAQRAMTLGNSTPLTALRPYFTRRQAALAVEDTRAASKGTALDPLVRNLASTEDPAYQLEILESLTAATEGKTKVDQPGPWSAAYAKLSVSPDPKVIAKADALAARFGDTTVFSKKRQILADTFAPITARQAALNVVLERNDFMLAPLYHKLLTEPGLRRGALRGLAPYDVPATPSAILAVYPTFDTEEKRLAVNLLAQRAPYARELLAAVKAGTVARSDLDASLARQLRLFQDSALDQAIGEIWGVVRESTGGAAEEIAKWKKILTPERLASANARQGRTVFMKACATCHVLFDEGAKIGPELTGSNRGELDYILANVVDPNAVIGKDYQLTTVETNDGRTAAGIVQRETPAAVTLVNMAETVTLSRDNIKKMDRLEMSLMPPGLFQTLPENEVVDLVAYLKSDRPVQ